MKAIYPDLLRASETRDTELLAELVRRRFLPESLHTPRLDVAGLLRAVGVFWHRHDVPLGSAGAAVMESRQGALVSMVAIDASRQDFDATFGAAIGLGHLLLELMPAVAVAGTRRKGILLRDWHGVLAGTELPRGASAESFALSLMLPRGLMAQLAGRGLGDETACARTGVPLPLLVLRRRHVVSMAAGVL